MSNIRQALIENIESDLRKITTGNGYNNTVFDVKRMHIWEQQVSVFPTVWFEIQNEQKNTGINEDETYFYNTINLLIGGYVKTSNDLSLTGVVVNEAESLLQDIYDCVEKRKPQSFTIDQISYIEPAHVKGIYPYITGKNNVVGVVVEVEIQYLQTEDASNINVTRPNAPTLSSPSNGGTSTSLYTQFDWASVSDAVSYHIQVGTDVGFNATIINQDYLIENSYTIPLDKVLTNGNTYYWKVRSFNQYGYSDWSSTYSFTVNSTQLTAKSSLDIGSCLTWFDLQSSTGVTMVSGLVASAMDKSGNSRHWNEGTSSNRPGLSGNYYNGLSAIINNGSTATTKHLSIADQSNVFSCSGGQTFTFMATYIQYPNSIGYPEAIISRSSNSIGDQWRIHAVTNSGAYPSSSMFGFPKGGGSNLGEIVTGKTYGDLRHFVLTVSNSSATAYLNGTKIATNNQLTWTTFNVSDVNTYVNIGSGRKGNTSQGTLSAAIFSASISNKLWTHDDVKSNVLYHYNYGLTGLINNIF